MRAAVLLLARQGRPRARASVAMLLRGRPALLQRSVGQ